MIVSKLSLLFHGDGSDGLGGGLGTRSRDHGELDRHPSLPIEQGVEFLVGRDGLAVYRKDHRTRLDQRPGNRCRPITQVQRRRRC